MKLRKISMRSFFMVTGSVIFGLVVVAWGFYRQFPYEEVKQQVFSNVERETSLRIRSESVKPSYVPLRFSTSGVELDLLLPDGSFKIASLPHLDVRVSISSLLSSMFHFSFRTDPYGGLTTGSFRMRRGMDWVEFESSLKDIDLSLWNPDNGFLPLEMEGRLNGTVSYECDPHRVGKGAGQGDFTLVSGTVRGLKTFLIPLDPLDIDLGLLSLLFGEGRLRIRNLEVKSSDVTALIRGDIVPQDPWKESILDLNVEASLNASVQERLRLPFDRIRLHLSGTPTRPKVRFE